MVILAFLLLATVSYTLDHLDGVGFARVRELLKTRVFADSKATSDLLGTVASSITWHDPQVSPRICFAICLRLVLCALRGRSLSGSIFRVH